MKAENFDALLFDCDGVIAETERDAHRCAFNKAFREKGLPKEDVDWEVDLYGELLKVGGGKERMTHFFDIYKKWPESVAAEDRNEKSAFIKELHDLKTTYFVDAVKSGVVPLRPGIQRLMDEALAQGMKVAICSTSSIDSVTQIVSTLLGADRLSRIPIFAGDMVSEKKPKPDVYNLAAKTLEVQPSRCWVIEDSNIGLQAGKSAGMNVCVTKSIYTENEDFSNNDLCIKDLDSGLDGKVTIRYLDYKLKRSANKSVESKSKNSSGDMFAADSQIDKLVKKLESGNPFGM